MWLKLISIKPFFIRFVLLLVSSITLVYIIVKAHATSFTHDESYTYLFYVHEPFMDIISYKHPYTNNHILNTVLIKYVEELFGTSELLLRLPNIIACIIYLVYSFKLLKKLSPWLIIPGFLAMLCNTSLLDFFCLARGYGLSIAFMVMSLYHLITYINTRKRNQLIWFNVGAFFAVLSNFSLLNYYAAALATYNIIMYIDLKLNNQPKKETYNLLKLNAVNLIAFVIFVAVLYEPIRRISKKGMLDFGGTTGFITDTFGSLVINVFYETGLSELFYKPIAIVLAIMLCVITYLIILKLYKKNTLFFREHKSLIVVNCILLFIVILAHLQHFLINNDYYTGRFALFLYPLLILNFVYFLNYVYQKQKLIALTLSYLLATLLLINVLANCNLHYYQEWKYDRSTKDVMAIIEKEHQINNKPIKLGINWLFEPTTNFYRYIHNLNWLTKTHRKGLQANDDYYYIFESDTNAYRAQGKPVLLKTQGINTILVKNKE